MNDGHAAVLPMRRMDRQYAGIQYLRGGAALTVLAVHGFMNVIFPIRTLGMVISLFFVISGFLVVAITSERSRPLRFMLARLRRIAPLYWILTLAAATMLWGGVRWQSPIPFWHVYSYDPPLPWRFIAASLGFVPAWNAGAGMIQPVIPSGWTVNLEMLYYAMFALLLFLPRRWLMAALTMTIGPLVLIGLFHRPDDVMMWTWTHPLGLEFLMGAWIGHAWQTGGSLWRAWGGWSLVTMPLVLLSFFTQPFHMMMLTPLVGPLFGLLFVLVLQAEERGSGIPVVRLPMLIGNASYSIYLVQFVVMLALDMAHMPRGLMFGSVLFALSLLSGIVIHYSIETPLLRLMGRQALSPAGSGSDRDKAQQMAV